MPYEFRMVRRIEFSQTDMAGIVHFANFFPMMEAAEHAFFRSLGFSIHTQDDQGGTMGWPRVSATCDYMRPLRFEDEVEVHLLVAEVRNRSIRYQFSFRKTSQNVDAARGALVAVCASLDPSTGRMLPMVIPGPIREQIVAAPPELLASRLSPGPVSP